MAASFVMTLALGGVASSPAGAQGQGWTAPSISVVKVVCRQTQGAVTTVDIVMNASPLAPGRRYLFAFKNAQNQTTKFPGPYGQGVYRFSLPAGTYSLNAAFAPLTGPLAPAPGWGQSIRSGIVVPAGMTEATPKGTICKAGSGGGVTPP